MTVVAISAAYGAHGGLIGPELARRLAVPFLDRAITHRVAAELEVSVDEAHNMWEPPGVPFLERVLASFRGIDTGAPVGPPPPASSPRDFQRAAESAVLEQAGRGEGVILGRGSVAALRERSDVLRVRLGGPRDRRLTAAVAVTDLTREQAAATMRRLDRYHAVYMREFYDVDIDDPALYHLALDATALPVEVCVDLIELAARAIRPTG